MPVLFNEWFLAHSHWSQMTDAESLREIWDAMLDEGIDSRSVAQIFDGFDEAIFGGMLGKGAAA